MKKTITFYLFAVLAVSALLLSTVNAQIISEEARRHMARGQAAVEIAKSPDEYDAAIKEFQQASRLAPDWRDPYYQLATLQEKTGKLKEAVASLKEYLRLAPNAPDAAKIQEQIYKLEYKAENTLTKADIISVLTSLSKWEAKGNCAFIPGSESFSYITPKSEGFINVLGLVDEDNGSKKYFQTIKVEGTTVKYRWTVMGHCQGGCGDKSFGSTLEEEIEVVSKTRVKVRQVVVWMGVIGRLGGVGTRYECELSPP